MKYTLPPLMREVGIEKYPARWESIFEAAMAEYDAYGCIYADERRLRDINDKYNAFPEYFGTILDAAGKIKDSEALGRYLSVLAMAVRQRGTIRSDISSYGIPQAADAGMSIIHEMIPVLAIAQIIPSAYCRMENHNVPAKVISESLLVVDHSIKSYECRAGRPGFNMLFFRWCLHLIDGTLLRIGRLNFDMNHKFLGRIRVFRNDGGDEIALADGIRLHRSGFALGSPNYKDEEGMYGGNIIENDLQWEGYPILEDGRAAKDAVILKKRDWHIVLQNGDPVINVHIPASENFAPEIVEQSYRDGADIIKRCYPEYEHKAFVCYSWLMDPQLSDLLKPDSNIVSFQKKYKKFTMVSGGTSVMGSVFNKPYGNSNYSDLPEKTSLQRTLKNHCLNGKYIYEPGGYFFYQ